MFDLNVILFDEYGRTDVHHVYANFVVCFIQKSL